MANIDETCAGSLRPCFGVRLFGQAFQEALFEMTLVSSVAKVQLGAPWVGAHRVALVRGLAQRAAYQGTLKARAHDNS